MVDLNLTLTLSKLSIWFDWKDENTFFWDSHTKPWTFSLTCLAFGFPSVVKIIFVLENNQLINYFFNVQSILWRLIFFYEQTGVGAFDFQYKSIGPGPCVHVTLDAILTLKLKNESNTQTLSLTGAKVTSGTCKADKTELTVSTAQSHRVHFLFTKSADGAVSISYKVDYKREGKGRCVIYLPVTCTTLSTRD